MKAPFVLLALLIALPAQAAGLKDQVRAWRQGHEAAIVGELSDLTALRSVAADPAGLLATADHLEAQLKARGLTVQRLATGEGRPPVIYGELRTKGAKRTVVFYAHYDGQPVTPSQWASDPFTPVMRAGILGPATNDVDWRKATALDPEWRLYGRAVSDDKASIVAALAALDALKAAGRKPSVNIKIFWEGQEEAGSTDLASVIKANAALLKADLWLIGDAPVSQTRQMQLYFGARGTGSLELTIYGPQKPLHDGHYGNWVPNPAVMAAELIARMRDSDGRILIPGFADGVRPLTSAEQAAIDALPPVEADLRQQFGIGRSEGGQRLVDSLMRPALNVRGLRAGQVGDQAANAIPSEAVISIDFRTVPGQAPVRPILEAWLKAKGWTLVEAEPTPAQRLANPRLIRLQWDDGYPAWRTDMEIPASKAVIASASRTVGTPVLILPMMGASVPMYLFADLTGAPVIGLPIVNHDNSQHAANENLRLQNLWDGVEVYAGLFADLDW
jgi:acetylornithine deacetylase/succinyl-diaminopimelate desuccinylase-like protein